MSKYNYKKLLGDHDNIMWFVLMGSLDGEIINKLLVTPEKPPEELEFNLTINGIEVNVDKFFNNFWDQYKSYAESDAKNLLKERTTDVIEKLQEKIDQLKELIEEKINEINLKP